MIVPTTSVGDTINIMVAADSNSILLLETCHQSTTAGHVEVLLDSSRKNDP